MLASTALVAVWMARYLMGYSHYLTGFREPFSLVSVNHFHHLIDVTPV